MCGARLADDAEAVYAPPPVFTGLKITGIDVFSAGALAAADAHDDEITLHDAKRGVYKKVVLREGRVVGVRALRQRRRRPLVGLCLRPVPDRGDRRSVRARGRSPGDSVRRQPAVPAWKQELASAVVGERFPDIDRTVLNGVVGILLVFVAAWLFCQPRIALGGGAERWAGPRIGLLAGIMGGVSGMFGPPLIAYMIGLGLRPNEFVKHIAILFLAAGATLLALGGAGAMSWADVAISTGALVPIYLGMMIGRWLRRHCPPGLFRALVLAALAAGGPADDSRRALLGAARSPARRRWQGWAEAIRLPCCSCLFSSGGGALMKALLAGMPAQADAKSATAAASRSEKLAAAAIATLLGLGVIWGVGFSHVPAWHNAAHDTRHSMAFPCH